MRFRLWFHQLLIALDQLFHVLFFGPTYCLFGEELPMADETISSKVGRYAIEGRPWALRLEKVIDWLFWEGHCRESIEWDEINK
jgi:hypothetical protein